MSFANLSPLAITADELCTQPYTQSLVGNVLSIFCNAGPVASFSGLWQEAQFDMNRAFPSGAAIAGILHKSKTTKTENALRKLILNNSLNDSGTGINLKIDFPYVKAVAKLQTIMKICTHFVKNVFQCQRGFQPFFCYKYICNIFYCHRKVSNAYR